MLELTRIPKVVTFIEPAAQDSHELINHTVQSILAKILPPEFKAEKPYLDSLFPLIVKKVGNNPTYLTFYSVSKSRPSAIKFFFEMLSRWLVPGERIDILLVFATDFSMPDISDDVYTLCEIKMQVDASKLAQIEDTFRLMQTELKLGLDSREHAHRILEIKGLSYDDKTSHIQEFVADLAKKVKIFNDAQVFKEIQHLLLITSTPFKEKRSVKLLSRIILSHFLFRKELRKHIKEGHKRRKTLLKVVRVENGVGISVGLSFFLEKEIFEERQFLEAIHTFFPNARAIEDSFVLNRRGHELLSTVYIEIEKDTPFSQDDIKLLKTDFARDIKNHVEQLMNQVFMPRNEEEIMRNILTLSGQLRFSRDLPQINISFDQQSRLHLFFTIILVRVQKKQSKPIDENFKGSFLKYIHDRSKIVGHIRNRYPKEAIVFRVKFRKEYYLRKDQSIDLYRARQAVAKELAKLIGEFRDFNGGMIHKQNELFLKVQSRLNDDKTRYNSLLLENFFYSLTPVIMQTILEPFALAQLFKMLNDSFKKGLSPSLPFVSKVQHEDHFVYVLFLAHDRIQNDQFDQWIQKFPHNSNELASIDVRVNEVIATGYVFRSNDESKRLLFLHAVENALKEL